MLKFINSELELIKDNLNQEPEPITGTVKVIFPEPISQAFVVLRGWKLKFIENKDNHIYEAIVKVELKNENVYGQEVEVKVTIGFRDKDRFDDPYSGIAYFTVVGIPKLKITEMTVRYE